MVWRERLKKLLDGHAEHAISQKAALAAIEQIALARGVILREAHQASKVLGPDVPAVLHLQCEEPRVSIYDEVHLDPGAGLPIVQGVLPRGIVTPGSQVLRHEAL
jgi:hypothetical protein